MHYEEHHKLVIFAESARFMHMYVELGARILKRNADLNMGVSHSKKRKNLQQN